MTAGGATPISAATYGSGCSTGNASTDAMQRLREPRLGFRWATRGGYFRNGLDNLRAANRGWEAPTNRVQYQGVRCADTELERALLAVRARSATQDFHNRSIASRMCGNQRAANAARRRSWAPHIRGYG